MSIIKNSGLHQYGPEAFGQQRLGTAGVEGVKSPVLVVVVVVVIIVVVIVALFSQFVSYDAGVL